MIAVTSGGRDRWEKSEAQMDSMMLSINNSLIDLLHKKLGDDLVFIAPIATEFFKYIMKAFAPYEVVMLDWQQVKDYKPIETKKRRCYIGWYNMHPFLEWSDKGIITKDDMLFLMGKAKDFDKFNNIVNIWMNVEGDLGLQFTECDRYHRVIHNVSGVVDDKVIFEDKLDDCKCGLKGATFTIKNELP